MSNLGLAMRSDEEQPESNGEVDPNNSDHGVPFLDELTTLAEAAPQILAEEKLVAEERRREEQIQAGTFDWSKLNAEMGFLWRAQQTPQVQAVIRVAQRVKDFTSTLLRTGLHKGRQLVAPFASTVGDARTEMREIQEVRQYIRENGACQKLTAPLPSQITIHDFRYYLYQDFAQFIADLGNTGKLHVPHSLGELRELVDHLLALAKAQLKIVMQTSKILESPNDMERVTRALRQLAKRIREFTPAERQKFMTVRCNRVRHINSLHELKAANQDLYAAVEEKHYMRACEDLEDGEGPIFSNEVAGLIRATSPRVLFNNIISAFLYATENMDFAKVHEHPDYVVDKCFQVLLKRLDEFDVEREDAVKVLWEFADELKKAEGYESLKRVIDDFVLKYKEPRPLLPVPQKIETQKAQPSPATPMGLIKPVQKRDNFEEALLNRQYGLIASLRLVMRLLEVAPLATKEEHILEIERLGRPLNKFNASRAKVSKPSPNSPSARIQIIDLGRANVDIAGDPATVEKLKK